MFFRQKKPWEISSALSVVCCLFKAPRGYIPQVLLFLGKSLLSPSKQGLSAPFKKGRIKRKDTTFCTEDGGTPFIKGELRKKGE